MHGGALAGFPSYVVINSDFSYLPTQLGGVASFLLAGGLACLGTQLFAADSPWQVRDALGASPQQTAITHVPSPVQNPSHAAPAARA